MPFTVTCPECDYDFRVPDSVEGQRGKCPKCKSVFVAHRPAVVEEEAPEELVATATVDSSANPPNANDEDDVVPPPSEVVGPAIAIPKPRLLESVAAPPPLAASPANAPPATEPPPQPATAAPSIQVDGSATMSPTTGPSLAKRRKKGQPTAILAIVAVLAFAFLAAGAGGVIWALNQDQDLESLVANADGEDVTTSTSTVPSSSPPTSEFDRRPAHDDAPSSNPFEAEPIDDGGEIERRDLPSRPVDDFDTGSEIPTDFPEPAPPTGDSDRLGQALKHVQQLHRILAELNWRPQNADHYLGFAEFAAISSVAEDLAERMEKEDQRRVDEVLSAAIEDLASAEWPGSQTMGRINKLATAKLHAPEPPGIFAYGRCILRPDDFGDQKIDGVPLYAFRLLGTEELVILPIRHRGADITIGSDWLILGSKDLNFEIRLTTSANPDEPRQALVVRTKYLLGEPPP